MTGACDPRRSTHARRRALAWVVACVAASCMVVAVVAAVPASGPEGQADAGVAQAVVRAGTIGHVAVPSMSPDVVRSRRTHGVVIGSLLLVLVVALTTMGAVGSTTLAAARSGDRGGAARSRPGASRAPPRRSR